MIFWQMIQMNIKSVEAQAMIAAVRNGSDLETACHYAGLSVNEIYKTLELGKSLENDKSKANTYPVLLWQELKKARANAVVRNVAHIQKAAQDGDWKAAAWWLEKALPDTYGKNRSSDTGQIENNKELK